MTIGLPFFIEDFPFKEHVNVLSYDNTISYPMPFWEFMTFHRGRENVEWVKTLNMLVLVNYDAQSEPKFWDTVVKELGHPEAFLVITHGEHSTITHEIPINKDDDIRHLLTLWRLTL